MSTRSRIAVAVAFIAAAAIAFLAIRSGGSSSDSTAVSTSRATKPVATTPAFRVLRVTVPVGKEGPTGGVRDISASAGERVVITVTSTGYSGEVHLHGFDIHHDVAPGSPAVFDVSQASTKTPKGQGSFDMELEATSTLIARLRVSP